MTRIAVAGAGVGGLTAALSLAAQGVAVELFERAPALQEVGAGVQLSPNATAALARLGLLDRVRTEAVRPEAVRIRRGQDGADLVRLPLGDVAEARFGAPFLVTHRADLQARLLDAAQAHPGVTVTTGATVTDVSTNTNRVVLTVRNGRADRVIGFDGLIGADGLRSRIRAALHPDRPDDRIFCGRTAWRALVPAAAAPPPSRSALSNLWLGRKAHLVHYPVRSGSLINVVAIVEDRWRGDAAGGLWAVPGDPVQLLRRFHGWVPDARALLEAAVDWRIWPLFDRTPLDTWTSGAIALIGDAAHPMLPFLAQGASQAIEDGWALGEAVRLRPTLASAFALYEQARRPTADRAQRDARRQGRIYHLGQPAAALRDMALRRIGPEPMLARYDWLYRLKPL